MRKADVDVREVVCSETGKPMAKPQAKPIPGEF